MAGARCLQVGGCLFYGEMNLDLDITYLVALVLVVPAYLIARFVSRK